MRSAWTAIFHFYGTDTHYRGVTPLLQLGRRAVDESGSSSLPFECLGACPGDAILDDCHKKMVSLPYFMAGSLEVACWALADWQDRAGALGVEL
jgi:hypothetical protein